MERYQEEYESFMKSYELSGGAIAVQEIAEMIANQAKHYARFNLIAAELAKPYLRLKAQTVDSTDAKTGKLIAVSKAEIMVDASEEAEAYRDAETAKKNIDRYINALTQLQYGTGKEYGHAGNI